MSFRPQMTASTHGIYALEDLHWRAWGGVVADLWYAEGRAGGGGHYLAPDPRLVIFLDGGERGIHLSSSPDAVPSHPAARICYIPAGMPLWSQIVTPGRFRHLDLHFAAAGLAQILRRRLGQVGAAAAIARPVMLDEHAAVEPLARLLAQEVQSPAQHDLYSEGLIQAILGAVLCPQDVPLAATSNGDTFVKSVQGGLSPHQMRRLTAFMQGNLHRRVAVGELAAQVGLSESWFARAFKHTHGAPPNAWQQELRVRAAQAMLTGEMRPLAEIADATGFSDQAHFTRAFRQITGTTPAAWRRTRI